MRLSITAVVVVWLLVACERPSTDSAPLMPIISGAAVATPTLVNVVPQASVTVTAPFIATPTLPPLPTATVTPFFTGEPSPACGQLLPLLPQTSLPTTLAIDTSSEAVATLREIVPEAARPALQRILSAPDTVGLVAYQLGDEANGVFLNADTSMPLASVMKLLHLVAYVEAVSAGQLDPNSMVPLMTLEASHIPNFDLGAHRRAVNDLREQGRIVNLESASPAVLLADVPWMMVRHSSNAATDYLHQLLGQRVIEETALNSLNLSSHTAPCPFLGQFLAMSNHTRLTNDQFAITTYVNRPDLYGQEVTLLADAYLGSEAFREAEAQWRVRQRRPSFQTQRLFTARLNPQATPRDYANLMLQLAQNGLSNAESSFAARRYLEWPMQFPDNQALFANLGLKNGSLPGVRTTAYYAYKKGEVVPHVVVLFYRDLPNSTYRRWRTMFPDDELARWLLVEETAVSLLQEAITPP